MKFVIIGAKGMLGQQLAKVFSSQELILWDKEDLDITDASKVREKILELQPQVIINSAAYNAVDNCEENFEIAKKINADGPLNLAYATNEVNAVLVHYSTDYVFEGKNQNGYDEQAKPAPISKYGESKYLGEQNVLQNCPRSYVIRLSRLFGAPAISEGAKKSFVDVMKKLGQEKEELKLVDEEKSCPTYAPDLANQTKIIVNGDYDFGLYHATNTGACTWYEFAKEIFRILDNPIKLIPVSGDEFPRPAKRPMYSELLNTKLPAMRPWQEAVKEYLDLISKS